MIRILSYELKRTLLNWTFIGMALLNGFFAWYVLTTEIIMGISYTAPFSVWSYCVYIGKTLPLIMMSILLILSEYYGKKQKQVEILTLITPVTSAKILFIQTAVLSICFCILLSEVVLMSLCFYSCFFSYTQFTSYILPTLIIIIPSYVFLIGLGQLVGRVKQSLLYLLMLFTFLLSVCGITNGFDLFGAGHFTSYPITLPVSSYGEPRFIIGYTWLCTRGFYILLGIVCIILNVLWKNKPTKA